MATSQFAEAAQREVTCPICYEFFVDPHVPKELECPHTCCQICLQKMVTLNPGDLITCPMRCEKKTHVPAGGVGNLRMNLHIRNLAEVHPMYTKGEKPAPPKCAKHNENMHLYCTHCNTIVCQNCVILNHKGRKHTIVDVCDTTKEQKEELKILISDTDREMQVCQKSSADLKKLESEILHGIKEERAKICRSGNDLINMVKREIQRLENEVQRSGDAKLDEIRRELTRLENSSSTLQDTCDVAKQTIESSDHAYITQHADLVEKIKKGLISINQQDSQANFNPRTAWFVNSSAKFGNVVELQQEFGKLKSGYNVASHDDELLAVSDYNEKEVTIYKKENNIYEKKLSLKLNKTNSSNTGGIVFCPDGRLWVARMSGIEVYSGPAYKYQKTISMARQADEPPCKKRKKKMPSDSTHCVYSLAITANGSRVVAGDIKRNYITVYDLTGNIIQTLKTSITPCKLAVIKDTHVAVSHWKPGNLVVMNIETGQESLNIGIDSVNALGYDKYSDSLLTGRKEGGKCGTGVIEQYCWKTGRKIACIAEQLYLPAGLTVTSDGLLAVADVLTMKIYKIT